MKTIPSLHPWLLAAAFAFSGSLACTQAGSFFSDFNSGLATNAGIYGNATIAASGGYTNSGCLKLANAVNSQNGGFIITNDLDNGTAIVGFTARFKLLIGAGNGADGFSFNFAPDLPLGTIPAEGAGHGLTIEFDTYNNGAPDTAPAIDVKVGGAESVPSTFYHGLRTGTFVDVVIQLNPDNTLSVAYDGTYIYSNLNLTTYGYAPAAGSLFGLGAATGGLNDNHWVDNLSITTQTSPAAFVSTFGPQGRRVAPNDAVGFAPNSAIDIVLTDDVTQVNTNSISLTLDGVSVSASITTNGSGETIVHYAPPGPFAYSSTHAVSLTFADNATLTPQTNTLQYAFLVEDPPFVPGNYVTVFSDGFETYVSGDAALDKNLAGGPNAAPNGSGNPWFGPYSPNARVVGVTGGVNPHSGTNMITGNGPINDGDEDWYNLVYRLRAGQTIHGNCLLDWWFYDINGAGDGGYGDYVALAFYDTTTTTTDYPGSGVLYSGATKVQRLSLGAAINQSDNPGPGSLYDSSKYQARVVNGVFDYAYGWLNTATERSIGWHHARIIAGSPLPDNTAPIYFYIDDMVTPCAQQNSATTYGFNVIEINTGSLTTLGYFDDVSFALAVPPNPTVTKSGNNAVVTWPGSGWTLQAAANVNGPYSDIVGASSGYTYDTTSNPIQFFRLRN
jgi:hypothetical protein